MSEYAQRLSDGAEIYIGSCEDIYQARWEQRNDFVYGHCKARTLPSGQTEYYYEYDMVPKVDEDSRWRLPYPDEDYIEVGNFDDNHKYVKSSYSRLAIKILDDIPQLAEQDGLIQFRNEQTGVLVNVPCYHGVKLPKNTDDVRFFWNGRCNPLRLSAVKNTESEMLIIIKCIACQSSWKFSYNQIAPYIVDEEMALRLLKDCQDYWDEKHDEPSYYELKKIVFGKDDTDTTHTISIFKLSEESEWTVEIDGEIAVYGEWELCREYYKAKSTV